MKQEIKTINIHIVLIVYALDVLPLIQSMNGIGVTWHVFTHSANEVVLDALPILRYMHNVNVYDYQKNRGLAKSWNEGLINAYAQGADVVVIANDDLIADFDDLLILAFAAYEHPEAGIVVCEGYNQRMGEQQILQFAIPAINPIAIEQIGYFDENFVPIYFEDSDYSRRAALAGVKFHNAGKTGIIHTGSATVASVNDLAVQNNLTFQRNVAYYCTKWGGPLGQETFTVPFFDAKFNLKITAEQRHDPYPDYSRTDIQEIVKI